MRTQFAIAAVVCAAVLAASPAPAQSPPPPEGELIDLGCDPGFGTLRTLYRDDIEAIDESYSFSIWPVCVGHPDPAVTMAGNAAGLHSIIAQNLAFAAALAEEGYEAKDVAGIRFGANNSVIVYVHRAY